MEKIEYSDLNKFFVSVGVVLMTISIIIIWLFFREPFDLLIQEENLDNLTEVAKSIIITRQTKVGQLLGFIPWVSLFLFFLGLMSLIVGIVRWWKKQLLLDERDILTNKKLKKELEKLSEQEVVEKAETEYRETIEEPETTTETTTKEEFVNSYLQIEQTIFDKIKLFFSDKYRVLNNYRLKHFEYDIILKAPLQQDMDKIIEIKYYPSGIKSQYIRNTLFRLDIALQYYQETMQKNIKLILIIVLPEEKYNLSEITKLKEIPKQLRNNKFDSLFMLFIRQNELNDLTKEWFTDIIEDKQRILIR